MRVRSSLPAVPAAILALLAPAASASPVCVAVRALPGNGAELSGHPCVPTSFVTMCRSVTVEMTSEIAYVEACVPKPPSS